MNKLVFHVIFTGPIFCECSHGRLDFIAVPEITRNPNECVALAGVLKFQTNKPVATKILLNCEDHSFTLNCDCSHNPSSGLPILGMKPGRTYEVKLLLQSPAEKLAYKKKLTFTTPELPSDPNEFPELRVTTIDEGQTESGITLLNPRRRIPGQTRLNSVLRD